VKNFLLISGLISLLFSCASPKPVSYPGSSSVPPPQHAQREPKFIENIVIKGPSNEKAAVDKPLLINTTKEAPGSAYSTDIEKCNDLQFKYAILMEEAVESILDVKLVSFLEHWYGAPYRYGGGTRQGIDCSAFTAKLMDSVYSVALPRTARTQFTTGPRIKKEQLSQGDLVFFNTTGGVSHVGVYLANKKFVHASTSSGVIISDLDDAYFKRRYVGAIRVR
jgi:lipoprotein Spr